MTLYPSAGEIKHALEDLAELPLPRDGGAKYQDAYRTVERGINQALTELAELRQLKLAVRYQLAGVLHDMPDLPITRDNLNFERERDLRKAVEGLQRLHTAVVSGHVSSEA